MCSGLSGYDTSGTSNCTMIQSSLYYMMATLRFDRLALQV